MRSQWRRLVAIQSAHERRQVFRNGGASGIGKFGPQSSRKRLHEFHRIERDSGQMAHFSAPPSLIVVNMTQSGKVFATGGSLFLLNRRPWAEFVVAAGILAEGIASPPTAARPPPCGIG